MAEAIARSQAKLIYTCNCTTKRGETDHFSVQDYLNQMHNYLPHRTIDYVIVNTNTKNILAPNEAVRYIPNEIQATSTHIIEADVLASDGRKTDGKKLATEIAHVCQP